jgi:hypothetical protein
MVDGQRRFMAPAGLHQADHLCCFGMERSVCLPGELILGKITKPRSLAVYPPAKVTLVVAQRDPDVERTGAVNILAEVNDPFRVRAQNGANVQLRLVP